MSEQTIRITTSMIRSPWPETVGTSLVSALLTVGMAGLRPRDPVSEADRASDWTP